MSDRIALPNDVTLHLGRQGSGRPLLFLHGLLGALPESGLLAALARGAEVLAPSHPGFGESMLPDWLGNIDDLAYLYLDLLDALDLRDVVLVGSCMGAWIAAEMMVRCPNRVARMVLVNPMGIKPGGRESRDYPDIYALHPDAVTALLWHRQELAPDPAALSDTELEALLRDRETAALLLWEPYMHNPRLPRRLHRIRVPTLVVRGERNGLISPAVARGFAGAIQGAQYLELPAAAHAVEYEQPDALAASIAAFMAEG
jgi:pimeloyl-ACP methyl ester carboxylesterase